MYVANEDNWGDVSTKSLLVNISRQLSCLLHVCAVTTQVQTVIHHINYAHTYIQQTVDLFKIN